MAPLPKAMLTNPRLLKREFGGHNMQSASPGPLPSIHSPPLVSQLSKINIEQFEVESQRSFLDVKKVAGDDGIPTRLLRMLSKNVAPCVFHLFRLGLKSGKLPTQWKQATMIWIYKKGDRSLPSNYRPISLLSSLSKVLERILFIYVCTHI